MANTNWLHNTAAWLTLLMLLSVAATIPNNDAVEVQTQANMDESEDVQSATGRQGIEAECEGLSFEDMFFYNYGEFHLEINSDWDGGSVRAQTWVNGTDAGNVREKIDRLFADLPGGDNGYFSTDELDGVEAVGKDCVAQTYTRLGFRQGPSHRGGQGVDWNNATWVKEGMTLEEWNLVPPNHPEIRNCQDQFGGPSGSPTCEEVPNHPASPNYCGSTSCDTMIWLNASIEFSQLTDPSNFTFSVTGTNLTNTRFTVSFPDQASPLRVTDSKEQLDCNVTYTEEDEEDDDYGVTYVPGGDCANYTAFNTREYTMRAVTGGTEFDTLFVYDGANWPALKEYFIDFTTAPPPVDNPPQWTANAPAEGDLIPIADLGISQDIIGIDDIDSWFSDELGAGLLTISCSGGTGWGLTAGATNTWQVTPPSTGDSTSVTCEATDNGGQPSGERNFTVGAPLTIAGTLGDSGADITVTATAVAPPSIDVTVQLVQDGGQVSSTCTVAGDACTMSIDIGALSPGDIAAIMTATGAGMAPLSYEYDLGLAKPSIAPDLYPEMVDTEWVDANVIVSGNFYDADGEAVVFSLYIDGVQMGQVSQTGNQWQTEEIPFDILSEGVHDVTVTGCDASQECSSVSVSIDNTHLFAPVDNTGPPDISGPSQDSGLPAVGIGMTVIALLSAGLLRRRHQK